MIKIGYDFDFTAGMHDGETLVMNLYQFAVEMELLDDDSQNHSIAFSRIKHFVDQEIDSTIFINSKNKEQCLSLINAGLNITTLPEDPVDQVINIMLFYKLNAIMENKIVIAASSLQSIHGGSITYFYDTGDASGPFAESGWWSEANLTHCDAKLLGSNIVNMQHSAIWRDLDLLWAVEKNKTDNNTAVITDFKRNG